MLQFQPSPPLFSYRKSQEFSSLNKLAWAHYYNYHHQQQPSTNTSSNYSHGNSLPSYTSPSQQLEYYYQYYGYYNRAT